MSKQIDRHDAKRIERSTAHAQKADMQRQPKLVPVHSALLDRNPFARSECEERLQFERRDLARQLAQTQKRAVPSVHRPSVVDLATYPDKEVTATLERSIPCKARRPGTRVDAGPRYRRKLHQNHRDPRLKTRAC